MQTIKDELAATGKPIEDEEGVSHILNGLDYEYNPLVSSIVGRSDPVALFDLFSQLIAYDLCLDMYQSGNQFQSSANSASRGRGGPRGRSNNNNRRRGQVGRGNSDGGRSVEDRMLLSPRKLFVRSQESGT